jgi:hypothetical protein
VQRLLAGASHAPLPGYAAAAIATGLVDGVLTTEAMPEAIGRVLHLRDAGADFVSWDDPFGSEYARILTCRRDVVPVARRSGPQQRGGATPSIAG